jgi:myo-inositol-1(or 4)-monophosphatase
VNDGVLLDVFGEVVAAIGAALDDVEDWTLAGARAGQYMCDLVADDVAVPLLLSAGVGVLSEESGLQEPERDVLVVMDPVDGSTNASRRIPWYATSLCAVDRDGPVVALVANLATGERFWATRGQGAHGDEGRLRPSACTTIGDAVVALSGWPTRHLGWRQMRALGAAALDLCAVAAGRVDAFIDCVGDASGVWDYLAAALICEEAGAVVADAEGRELIVRDHTLRRTPVAAATRELLDQALAVRASLRPRDEMD